MGASLILAINVTLGLAIMCSFLAFGLYDRSQKAAFWWFAACVAGVMAGLLEYSLPPVEITFPAQFLIYVLFTASLCCLTTGLAVRYAGRVPWLPVLLAFALAVGCYLAVSDMPRASLTRNVVYQTPYTLICLIGFYYVLAHMKPSAVDRAVAITVAIHGLHYLLRPPLVILLGGNGVRAQDYLGTNYAMVSQTLLALTMIAVAFALGIRLLTDMLASIRSQSDFDALSGVMNRDSFTRRAISILAARGRTSRPMALMLCDLDHFKAINDTHGHQTGDRVIAAFGGLLTTHARKSDVAGRFGGEEFCVLLSDCDGGSARLFAERVRMAFETGELNIAELESRPTASFGVSEVAPGESFESAYIRADQALYVAKRAGRNRVRQWTPPISLVEQAKG